MLLEMVKLRKRKTKQFKTCYVIFFFFLCVTFPLKLWSFLWCDATIIPAAANWSAVPNRKGNALWFFSLCSLHSNWHWVIFPKIGQMFGTRVAPFPCRWSGLSWRGQTWATAPVANDLYLVISSRGQTSCSGLIRTLFNIRVCNIITVFMSMATLFFNLTICEWISWVILPLKTSWCHFIVGDDSKEKKVHIILFPSQHHDLLHDLLVKCSVCELQNRAVAFITFHPKFSHRNSKHLKDLHQETFIIETISSVSASSITWTPVITWKNN